MNAKKIIRQLNETGIADDLLHGVGLETRASSLSRLVGGLGILAAGALVGIGAGLVLAPMTGDELRQKAKGRVDDLVSRVGKMREEAASVGEAVRGAAAGHAGHKEPTPPVS